MTLLDYHQPKKENFFLFAWQQPGQWKATILWSPAAAAAAKSLQSCPTLCDPIDGSPPGSPVPGILQTRTLEWVAISSSNAWKWKVKVKLLSRVRLLATPWTAAHQAPPSMGLSEVLVSSNGLFVYNSPSQLPLLLQQRVSSPLFHWTSIGLL